MLGSGETLMAKYCKTCPGSVCDFCKWYDFNGNEEDGYTGDGFCRRWQSPRDPDDGCNEFICHCLKDGDPWYDRPARPLRPRTEPPDGKWVKTTPPDPLSPARGAPS